MSHRNTSRPSSRVSQRAQGSGSNWNDDRNGGNKDVAPRASRWDDREIHRSSSHLDLPKRPEQHYYESRSEPGPSRGPAHRTAHLQQQDHFVYRDGASSSTYQAASKGYSAPNRPYSAQPTRSPSRSEHAQYAQWPSRQPEPTWDWQRELYNQTEYQPYHDSYGRNADNADYAYQPRHSTPVPPPVTYRNHSRDSTPSSIHAFHTRSADAGEYRSRTGYTPSSNGNGMQYTRHQDSTGPLSAVPSSPHLRNHFHTSSSPSSRQSRESTAHIDANDRGNYTNASPSAHYIALSNPYIPPPSRTIPKRLAPKLLVFDLNGALIYRTARQASASSHRTSYPRPYVGNLLEYVFGPDPSALNRAWEAFVWSSAQPHNVKNMVEGAFDSKWIEGIWAEETENTSDMREVRADGSGQLLGVWARDKMGLSNKDYGRKTQTTKDLRKLLSHITDDASNIVDRLGYQPTPEVFNERSIILLDDSPLKAIFQPWNQIVLPEFDKKEWQASKAAAASGVSPGAKPKKANMDQLLLAVIGILEALGPVNNVPAWIRAGGLSRPDLDPHEWDADGQWIGEADVPWVPEGQELPLHTLPSYESYAHWYQDKAVLARWVEKGLKALERRGIPVDHGMKDLGGSTRSTTKDGPEDTATLGI